MIYYMFELSMPCIGSWNGKWSGAYKKHTLVRSYVNSKSKPNKKVINIEKSIKNHGVFYDFGDGWSASISIKKLKDGKEAAKEKKLSAGFCGYDWMISDIEEYGRIRTKEERK